MKTVRPVSEWKKGEPIGSFIDTYYYNVIEADYPGPQTVPVKDGKGNVIARVTSGFWERFSVEGTACSWTAASSTRRRPGLSSRTRPWAKGRAA